MLLLSQRMKLLKKHNKMSLLNLLLFLVITPLLCHATNPNPDFIFTGFRSTDLTLKGIAEIKPNGLLALTNGTRQKSGYAFYPNPITFKNSPNESAISFSTSFVFGIIPEYPTLSGHGISFVIAPQPSLPNALPSQYLGLFNESNNGNITNQIIAVEFDTIQSTEFNDINDNHVGIDINGLDSVLSYPAGYYGNDGRFQNLSLISGNAMRVWIEYDGGKKQMNVTMGSIRMRKPSLPTLSLDKDLSQYINPIMYVGFASSTGSVSTSHYLLGWSFKMNGEAKEIDSFKLPKLPRINRQEKMFNYLTMVLPFVLMFVLAAVISAVVYYVRRKRKFAEEIEDWELDYGPHRFKYKDLYFATKGFNEKGLLGTGGFGQVYKGVLSSSKMDIAVKRVSHQSRQGMREFVAEIVSIGRLRHRNLVQLLGYCRRKNELLLVYDYMSNGSLDKLLYDEPGCTLNWRQRFRVIKGVAAGLLYLHEEWEQVVIHRDVKASNVLLDSELNAKLGDFGLSRLYDHGTDPRTTHVVGTIGYLAPEHTRTGKATPATDVYSFGAFLLEVASGKRPIGLKDNEFILVDWIFCFWSKGLIFNAVDPNLGGVFDAQEVEMVMKLGLLCSNTNQYSRPTMRQVVQFLEGDIPLPDISSLGISAEALSFAHKQGFEDFSMSYSSSLMNKAFSTSMAGSHLSGGR
ncbi:L-type lectin-domain containing receptor kinase IV.1-like [Impatiens glandulifera]|uniref:L-type lectin-domain containing receptor kinase IV.1-like n=1 Tax=Impatiens glandulifera TaxID=253017 RepID=UPI001FB193DC|nr:L-type lectin-domain containing receptor kinase IV.1-like [Impatiens glandulifera]